MPDLAQLGRYLLLGRLASGGMAELFLARQTGPQGFSKTVVIKRILESFARDRAFVDMFLNEARLAALINHPNIVSIYELGEDAASGNYYIVMEFIDGPNLKKLAHAAVRTQGSVPIGIACRLVADACGALDFAHNLTDGDGLPLRLVHRDVSPENILVTFTGQVKVVDFGIAKALAREGQTAVGQIKGKLGYMSPEQVRGKGVDRRTDVWALGVTLYWLFTGMKPFRGTNPLELAQKVVGEEFQPPGELRPDLPPELSLIIARALAKDPEARYATARELQQALETWITSSGSAVSTSTMAHYLDGLFPASTDPDRALARSLMAIRSDAFTPTDVPLLTVAGPAPAFGSAPSQPPLAESSAVGALSRRQVPLGAVVGGALLVLGGVGFGIWAAQHSVGARESGPRAAPELAQPQVAVAPTAVAPIPTPAPAPAAIATPPTVAPAVPTLPDSPKPAPTARAERPHPAPHPRAGPGTLELHVVPWADVYLDGHLIGTTPLEPMEVPSGRHKLRLVNDRIQASRQLTVDVKPGETASVTTRLQ